jgi:hypothetical protein
MNRADGLPHELSSGPCPMLLDMKISPVLPIIPRCWRACAKLLSSASTRHLEFFHIFSFLSAELPFLWVRALCGNTQPRKAATFHSYTRTMRDRNIWFSIFLSKIFLSAFENQSLGSNKEH